VGPAGLASAEDLSLLEYSIRGYHIAYKFCILYFVMIVGGVTCTLVWVRGELGEIATIPISIPLYCTVPNLLSYIT